MVIMSEVRAEPVSLAYINKKIPIKTRIAFT